MSDEFHSLQNIFMQDLVNIHKGNSNFSFNEYDSEKFIATLKELRFTPSFEWSRKQKEFVTALIRGIKELRDKVTNENMIHRDREEYFRLMLLGHDYNRYELAVIQQQRRRMDK